MVDSVPGHAPAVTRLSASRALILYDGLCGLCNTMVQGLLKRDRHDRFRFAPQQSAIAETILRRHGIDLQGVIASNSAYLVMHLDSPREKVLVRSDVGIQALLLLGGGWRVLGRVLQAVPQFARDAAYTVMARNRFRFSARYAACPVPSAAERAKFLG